MNDLIGNARAFPALAHYAYLNHAGVAPLPGATADAVRAYLDAAQTSVYLERPWYPKLDALRLAAARLINAAPTEIAFIKNTSEGISWVANGLEWQVGDRIVTANIEYPANVYPWMELQRRRGVELVMVDEVDLPDGSRAVPVDALLTAADHPRTRLLALSHVEYASGQRHDLPRIGAFCRARGILFCVDIIQSLGALPVDVEAMQIDFAAACGHKWMLSPEGAGIFYIRRALLDTLAPSTIGASNVINFMDYGHYDYTLRPDASRFESGTHNAAGLIGLLASAEMFGRIGIDAVWRRVQALGDRLVAGLSAKGYRVISPRTPEARSGIVAFTSPGRPHDEVIKLLRRDHKIEIALREGRLRASPHFYNTDAQMDRLIEALP